MSIVYCNAQYFMNHNNFKRTEMGVMQNGWGQKGKGPRDYLLSVIGYLLSVLLVPMLCVGMHMGAGYLFLVPMLCVGTRDRICHSEEAA
jgi:hypothetical protein